MINHRFHRFEETERALQLEHSRFVVGFYGPPCFLIREIRVICGLFPLRSLPALPAVLKIQIGVALQPAFVLA